MDLFFRGAVAKVFDPTIKFDFCAGLDRKAGSGKDSIFLRGFSLTSILQPLKLSQTKMIRLGW